jgi:septum formation protein
VRIWLASASPRRKALLEAAGFAVDVHPSGVDEARHPGVAPVAHAATLARAKAESGPDDRVVLAADTVVHRGDALFDKPVDRAEAAAHLASLSGGWHTVTTALCVRSRGRQLGREVHTEVRFRALSADDIERYLATGDADDKAGAYGIQGVGGALVAELRGSYTNVVGLPLEEALAAIGEVSA